MDFLRILSQIRSPLLTQIFSFFTLFGEETVAVIIICSLYWCFNKSLAKQLTLSYFTSGLLIQNLKITFRIERPWILDTDFKPVPSALKTATGYSFPSGHTQSSTSVFSSFAFNSKKRWLKVLFIGIFILTGFSRMYLGVHTPKDVLVSMCISFCIAYAIYKANIIERLSHNALSLIIFFISVIFTIYGFIQLRLAPQNLELYSDAFKVCGSGLAFAAGWYIEPKYINFDEKSGNMFFQIIKLVIGLLAAILLKTGLKPILGTSAFGSLARYFIIVIWIMIIYPLIFKSIKKH